MIAVIIKCFTIAEPLKKRKRIVLSVKERNKVCIHWHVAKYPINDIAGKFGIGTLTVRALKK